MSFDSFYREEITTISFAELRKLLEWINLKGVTPTIIGGWAVWSYERGLGSRDIDIVIPNLSTVGEEYTKKYFEKNGYIARYLNYQVKKYEKTIQGMKSEDIIVDVFDGNAAREDLDGLGVKFHWGWMLEFREKHDIDGLEIFVPKREILIVIKVITALSRLKEYFNFDRPRLPAKIWKDYRDVAALSIRTTLDKQFFKEYIKKSNLENHLDDFVSKYKQDSYTNILTDLKFDYKEIKSVFEL